MTYQDNLNNNFKIKKNKNFFSGFTLIEVLVSTSILVGVLLVSTSIFKSTSDSQKSISSDFLVLNNIEYATNLISKNIAEAEIGDGSVCEVSTGRFFDYVGSSISFIKEGDCYFFSLVNDAGVNRILMDVSSRGSNYITSKNINIEKLIFSIEDNIAFGQPIVTFFITGKSSESSVLSLQTSVSVNYYE